MCVYTYEIVIYLKTIVTSGKVYGDYYFRWEVSGPERPKSSRVPDGYDDDDGTLRKLYRKARKGNNV